jgi:2,4-dienoyl-CoA reductase-like NADH-dependent reductase (Old Yellow Enzyme family)
MSSLFSPFEVRDLLFRNRVFVSPMCQYSADNGVAGPWHMVHYGSRAVGGAGLVMFEATAISPEGRISPNDLGLWNDEQAEALIPIVEFIKVHGAVPGIQLAHAGRKASTALPWLGGKALNPVAGGWEPVAPSSLPFSPEHLTPHELTAKEITDTIDAFAKAAQRALDAGFEVVEVHMAHGYLLHEFLSPLSNQRSDTFGGSLENRMRLPMLVTQAVREVWPGHLPIFVRISATDWVENGWDLQQSIQLSRKLKNIGVDLVDCSSGGLLPLVDIPVEPGFQVPFATAIRNEADIATGAVGLITEPEQAEQIIKSDQADVVLLARQLLRDPYWPLHAAKTLQADVHWPHQYLRAKL